MKVLIIGATGFIGLPAAQAFVRAGHIVYGLTRSAEKAKQLAAEEIIPIVGEVGEPEKWLSKDLVATLDVLIDAVGGTARIDTLGPLLLNAAAKAAKQYRVSHAPKLTYIYTSGIWVHGDNRKDIVSDTTPLINPIDLTSWRAPHEQDVINDTILNGIVIRPALLYGRSGSLVASLFKQASEGKVTWFGKPGGRFALIHTDDLADLYLLAGEKAQLVGGKIFDAANDFTESVDDFLGKLVEISGAAAPYTYVPPTNVFESALTTTTLVRPYLARALLGWQPRKAGLVEYLQIYYDAWKASAGVA